MLLLIVTTLVIVGFSVTQLTNKLAIMTKNTKKLPFRLEPKGFETVNIGNNDINILEVPKYGSLTPNENYYIKRKFTELGIEDLQTIAVNLAQDIAIKSNMRLIDVYNALTQGNTEVLSEYLTELITFQKRVEETQRDRIPVLATAIIRYRINNEWELEDSGNPELIHPDLIKEIANFAIKEQSGWEVVEEVNEEDLKKSSEAEDMNPIGENSIGE